MESQFLKLSFFLLTHALTYPLCHGSDIWPQSYPATERCHLLYFFLQLLYHCPQLGCFGLLLNFSYLPINQNKKFFSFGMLYCKLMYLRLPLCHDLVNFYFQWWFKNYKFNCMTSLVFTGWWWFIIIYYLLFIHYLFIIIYYLFIIIYRMMWAAGSLASVSMITYPSMSALVSCNAEADQQGL